MRTYKKVSVRSNARKPLFPLGKVKVSSDAKITLRREKVNVDALLERHQSGDWGFIYEEERLKYERRIRNQSGIVLSQYNFAASGLTVLLATCMGETVETEIAVSQESSLLGRLQRWLRITMVV